MSKNIIQFRQRLSRVRQCISRWLDETRIRWQQPSAPIRVIEAVAVTETVPVVTQPSFDAERAYSLLRLQCEGGSRCPGSDGRFWLRRLILEQLSLYADEVAVQEWQQKVVRGPGAGETFGLTNLFAVFRGEDGSDEAASPLRADLMLSAHWDTRPVADSDPDLSRRTEHVTGAKENSAKPGFRWLTLHLRKGATTIQAMLLE